jgi:hypothetical protein
VKDEWPYDWCKECGDNGTCHHGNRPENCDACLTTTPQSPLIRNPDGTASATVTIKLTPDQWLAFERKFSTREIACQIGLDEPQVSDFVMFQIFGQIGGGQ